MKKFEEEIILSKTNKITLDEMNPFVRRASKHVIEAGLNTGVRVNIHYQLHYILRGVGTLIIEDQVFSVSEGDFIIWCPGDVHTIESDRKEPLEVIGVQFDFTRNFSMLHYPCIHYSKESFSWDKVNEIIVLNKIKNITLCTKMFEQKSVKRYLEDLVGLYESRSVYSEFSMGGLLKVIILLVLEGNQYKVEKFKIKKEVINEVSAYIKKHYSDKLTNDFLGVQCGYHPNHLNHMFLKHTGFTLQQYIIHIRMEKAVDLLLHSNQTISEIGYSVGGYSIHYFSRLFRKKMGLTPSDYRNP